MVWAVVFGFWGGIAQANDEVVVEGERDDAQESSTATEIAIDDTFSGSDDVATAVSLSPGTTVRRLGGLGAWSGVSIRGSTFRHVVVAIDGLPLNPDGSGAIDLSTLPLRAFDAVRVYRGVVPLHFGVAPMGGVVDLQTAEDVSPQLRVGLGQWRTGRLQGAVGGEGWFAATDVFRTDGDFPYFSDNQTPFSPGDDGVHIRDNQRKFQWTGHGRATGSLGPIQWTVQDTALWRMEGLPGPISRPTQRTSLQTGRNIAQLALEGGGERGTLWGRVSHILRSERYRDPEGELGVGAQDQTDGSHTVGLNVGGRWIWSETATTAVSIRARSEQWSRRLASTADFSTLFSRFVLSGQVESPVFFWRDRLSLRPGFAGTWSPGASFGWAPQVAVRLEPTGNWAVWTSVGRGFRLPDMWELYGDRGVSVGNPELSPESGWRGDIGGSVEGDIGSASEGSLSLVGFFKRDQDRIVYVQNATSTLVPVNFGNSRAWGLEGAVRWNWSDRIQLQGQWTFLWTENLDGRSELQGNRLPRVPLATGTFLLSAHPHPSLSLGYTLTVTAGNYWDATNWYLSPPRHVHNGWLRLAPDGGPLAIELSVLNLFDRTTASMPLDPLQPDLGTGPQPIMDFSGYPLPGRTAMIQVSWLGD